MIRLLTNWLGGGRLHLAGEELARDDYDLVARGLAETVKVEAVKPAPIVAPVIEQKAAPAVEQKPVAPAAPPELPRKRAKPEPDAA